MRLFLLLAVLLAISINGLAQKVEIRPRSKTQNRSFMIELIVADSLIEASMPYAGWERYFYSISKTEFGSIKGIINSLNIPEPNMSQIYSLGADISILIIIVEGDRVNEFYLESPESFKAFFGEFSDLIQNVNLKRQLIGLKEFSSHLREKN
ncbi:hypothetical protein [Croceimicrobium sp.]|uniref:hypothetical protein n=1 Tax=Croceimicrobium sp. TaxID=2828340 RepID=UPI003BABA27A